MIENTVFDNESLKKVVKEIYGIEVNEITKLDRGSANLYSLNNNSYILKEFQSKYTKEEILKEINIINHLRKDNVLVPEYIKTKEGEYYFLYKGKIVILQKFIEGYTIESNTGTFEQTMDSARQLGKLVKSLETIDFFIPVNDVKDWYSLETIESSIKKQKELILKANGEYKETIINDLESKISMLEYIKDNVDLSEMDNMTLKNTHGDYSLLQFIYNGGKIKAIIDFVSACKMPVVWEVIRSYSYIDKEAKSGIIDVKNLTEYVKEFSKYVELNKYDIKYMIYIYLVQLLTSTFGYKQYILDNTKKSLLDFAFFRTNLCKYMFSNRDSIVDSLMKGIFEE